MREKTESLLDFVTVAVAPRLLSLWEQEPSKSLWMQIHLICAGLQCGSALGKTISFTKHLVFFNQEHEGETFSSLWYIWSFTKIYCLDSVCLSIMSHCERDMEASFCLCQSPKPQKHCRLLSPVCTGVNPHWYQPPMCASKQRTSGSAALTVPPICTAHRARPWICVPWESMYVSF